MNLADARGYYEFHSGKASEVSRQLSLAGVALIWIFKAQQADQIMLPDGLRVPAFLLVVALGADLLQYVVAAAVWGAFHRSKERERIKPDKDFTAHPRINWPALIFFYLKIAATISAYVLIGNFVFRQISWSAVVSGALSSPIQLKP